MGGCGQAGVLVWGCSGEARPGGGKVGDPSRRGSGVTLRAPDQERARAIYGTVALTSHRASRSHLEGRIRSARAIGGFLGETPVATNQGYRFAASRPHPALKWENAALI